MTEIARLLDDLEARRIPDDELRHRVRLARTELQRMERNMTDGRLYGQDSGPTSASGGTGVSETKVDQISDLRVEKLRAYAERVRSIRGAECMVSAADLLALLHERERAEKAEAPFKTPRWFPSGGGIYQEADADPGPDWRPGNDAAKAVRAEADAKRLREALEPFAKASDDIGEGDKYDWHIWEHPSALDIKVVDLFRAKKALSPPTPAGTGAGDD